MSTGRTEAVSAENATEQQIREHRDVLHSVPARSHEVVGSRKTIKNGACNRSGREPARGVETTHGRRPDGDVRETELAYNYRWFRVLNT